MALKATLDKLTPKSVFITGANRGIGLNFVKHLLELPKPPCHIFTTCRDPSKAQVTILSLKLEMKKKSPNSPNRLYICHNHLCINKQMNIGAQIRLI